MTERIQSVSLDAEGNVTTSPSPRAMPPAKIHVSGGRLYNGDKPITPEFEKIDSFDVSESRGEVAFSAKREKSFDIGLVGTEGGTLNWLPPDAADEIDVQWAPRGNKVSFIVRAIGGDVVKTFHVPSSYWLNVPFTGSTVHALGWDPQAERYAAVYSSLIASDAVDVVKYGGEDRRTAIKPAEKLNLEAEPLAPGALLLRPADLAYDEKLPLVFWAFDGLGWNDAFAALMRRARLACVVTRQMPDQALRKAAAERTWIDPARTFVVSPRAGAMEGALVIHGDSAIPPGRYRKQGSEVSVEPAVVQSFAAGFIPEVLKSSAQRIP